MVDKKGGPERLTLFWRVKPKSVQGTALKGAGAKCSGEKNWKKGPGHENRKAFQSGRGNWGRLPHKGGGPEKANFRVYGEGGRT